MSKDFDRAVLSGRYWSDGRIAACPHLQQNGSLSRRTSYHDHPSARRRRNHPFVCFALVRQVPDGGGTDLLSY